jgi:hypothetical protein
VPLAGTVYGPPVQTIVPVLPTGLSTMSPGPMLTKLKPVGRVSARVLRSTGLALLLLKTTAYWVMEPEGAWSGEAVLDTDTGGV